MIDLLEIECSPSGICTIRLILSFFDHVQMTLAIKDESTSGKLPGSPISPLQVDITEETEYRLHIKVTDPNQQRWEIPER